MNRIATLVLAGAVALATVSRTEAQKAGQAQGQAQGQAGSGGQKGGAGTIGQTPWFSNQGVQKQLNLNNEQLGQLNKAYGQAWGSYQKGLSQLGNDTNLSATDRAQRMRDLEANFHKSFSSGINDSITDPAARQRFNQLSWQYRGYGAFSDPMVQQKLNLTAEQRQKLNEYQQDWTTRMNELNPTFSKDATAGGKRFSEMQKQADERINSVLTPEQRQTWQQMIGERYNFEPGAYFQSNNQGGGNSGGSGNK